MSLMSPGCSHYHKHVCFSDWGTCSWCSCQHLQLWSTCCVQSIPLVIEIFSALLLWTVLVPLLQSSRAACRWIHCFLPFAHSSFIAMFKDHTCSVAYVVLFTTFDLKSGCFSGVAVGGVLQCSLIITLNNSFQGLEGCIAMATFWIKEVKVMWFSCHGITIKSAYCFPSFIFWQHTLWRLRRTVANTWA